MAENSDIKQDKAIAPHSSASSVFEFMRICYNLKVLRENIYLYEHIYRK